MSNMIMHMFYK